MALDIPSRDMRLMDTNLVNYETIGQLLVRDNALVFSMEHVRLIIMADKVRGKHRSWHENCVSFLVSSCTVVYMRMGKEPGTKG